MKSYMFRLADWRTSLRSIFPIQVWWFFLVAGVCFPLSTSLAQQPYTSDPLFKANSKYVQGVGPGYWPTAGSGLTLIVAAGTAYCNAAVVNYPGGTLTMAASQTNYVYLDPVASCAPARNTTGFSIARIPLAIVITSGGAITSITDVRNWFAPVVGAVASTGETTISSAGTDQNLNLVTAGVGTVNVKRLNWVNYADQFCTTPGVYDETCIVNAIADFGGGRGVVLLGPYAYDINNTVTISTTGMAIIGAGPSSVLKPKMSGDAFVLSGELITFADLEVQPSNARTGSIFKITGSQITFRDLRVTGAASVNNGAIFTITGSGSSGNVRLQGIRVPGGVTWTAFLKAWATAGTTSGIHVTDLVAGNTITWSEAGIVLDSGVDGFECTGCEGPRVLLQNTISGNNQPPEWIRFVNSFLEAGVGGALQNTAIDAQAVRDLRFENGYVASSQTGVAVGANAQSVAVVNSHFVSIGQSAVTISSGAQHTTVAYSSFEDTGKSANNTYDTIAVAAGASDFRLTGNAWRATQANLPRYGINVASGNSNNFQISGNNIPASAVATAALSNGASGATQMIWANAPNLAAGAEKITSVPNFTNGVSFGSNAAQSGLVRLPNSQAIYARNNAGGADINLIDMDTSDQLRLYVGSWLVTGVAFQPNTTGSGTSRQIGTTTNRVGTIRGTAGDFTKAVWTGVNVVTFSATPTFDASLGNTQKITLTGNVTSSTLSNATTGEVIVFIICQDATGGRTFVWPTNVKGGMTIGSTLSTCSAQNLIFDGTNAYALSAGMTNM